MLPVARRLRLTGTTAPLAVSGWSGTGSTTVLRLATGSISIELRPHTLVYEYDKRGYCATGPPALALAPPGGNFNFNLKLY